jgi:AAA domain
MTSGIGTCDMTNPLSRTLRPPASWADELCMLRNLNLIGAESAYQGRIVLSYPPRQLAEWDVDLDAVRADFEDGLRIRTGHAHPGGRRFWLEGNRYEAEVLSKRADGHGRPIAFVLRLAPAPANAVPRRAGYLTCPVEFDSVRAERDCDIGEVYAHVQRVERYRAAHASASRAVRHAPPDAQMTQHSELHRLARKRYGALRGLLSLLALRAERSVATAEGVIMSVDEDDADSVYLNVELSRHDRPLSVFNDAQLEISAPGGQARTTARNLSGQIIALDRPQNGPWAPGTAVTLTTVPRFSMKQHDQALERFLHGEVEGDWDDLAALLCKPALLDLASRPLPPRFFCDEDTDEDPLNDAQRLAVAGALATPHAFVIQGPPGTGKTTVICEIIRQLSSRKQRVLLLAPQHVAVDEVLRRIGRKPGIRALRLSWDEARVDERVRGFLPDRVGKEFIGVLRRPGPNSDTHWAARHQGLVSEKEAVDRLFSAQQVRYQAGTALVEAQASQASTQRRLEEARTWLDKECQERQNQIAAARQALAGAEQEAAQAAQAADRALAEFSSARPPIDALLAALEELRDAGVKLDEAAATKMAAEREHAQYRETWTRELDHAARALAASEEPWRRVTSAAAAAYERHQAAATRLAEIPGRHRTGQRLADRLGIGLGARRQAEAERARQEWVDLDRERQRQEAERQRWTTSQHRLSTDATPGRLAANVAQAGERLEAAGQNRSLAAARWHAATRDASGEARQHCQCRLHPSGSAKRTTSCGRPWRPETSEQRTRALRRSCS